MFKNILLQDIRHQSSYLFNQHRLANCSSVSSTPKGERGGGEKKMNNRNDGKFSFCFLTGTKMTKLLRG